MQAHRRARTYTEGKFTRSTYVRCSRQSFGLVVSEESPRKSLPSLKCPVCIWPLNVHHIYTKASDSSNPLSPPAGSIFSIGTTGLRDETLNLGRSGGDVLAPPSLPSRCSESPCPGSHHASLGRAPKGSPLWWQACSWHEEGQGRLRLPPLVVAAAWDCGSLNVPSLFTVMRRRRKMGSFLWRGSESFN